MELWDAYDKDLQKIADVTLVRGEPGRASFHVKERTAHRTHAEFHRGITGIAHGISSTERERDRDPEEYIMVCEL